MKHLILWGSLGAISVLALGMMTTAFSQPPHDGRQPGATAGNRPLRGAPPVHTVMGSSAEGIFTLTGNALVKYDATTLKELGRLTLDVDAPAAAGDAKGAQAGPPMGPSPSGTLCIPEGELSDQVMVILGTTFYRVDGGTLQVKATSTLPLTLPEPPQGGTDAWGPPPQDGPNGDTGPQHGPQGMQHGQAGPPPGGPGGPGERGRGSQLQLELHGKTLYLLAGEQLLAVDATTGKVTGNAALTPPQADKAGKANRK